MTTSKRKIKAEPFVTDLRSGLDDGELMEKYSLSESQLHKLMRKLIDAGALDEMELFMRTYLSDSFMTKAFGGARCAMDEMGPKKETISLQDSEPPSDLSVTEKVNTASRGFIRMLAKFASARS